MPDAFRVEVDATKFKRAVANMPEVFRSGLNRATLKIGVAFQNAYKRDRLRGRPGVERRSGNLSAKFFNVVTQLEDGRVLVCGFGGVPYANLQEHGGTIVPRRVKWLTIPVGPALTASNVAKGPARSFPGLKFVPGKRPGTAFLVMPPLRTKGGKLRKGQDERGTIYFVLKKSVRVPGRLGFFPSFKAHFAEGGAGRQLLNQEVAALVARINGGSPQ